MPMEITPPSEPTVGHARTPKINSRDVTPLSLTPLAIIAILVLVLHLTSSAMGDRPHADPAIARAGDEAGCLADVLPRELSLPID
jgi:hypothetical protein